MRSERLLVSTVTDVASAVAQAREANPALMAVDSIQAMRCPGVESVPGSVSQVREAAARFARRCGSTTLQTRT